ncbi:MAG: four helix bundle protein [Clostridia bacterium]|nr:four helix bundle protein [Clostridia bacterium]MBR3095435.1 four helix bundle protein [Clostridia bacterium]
MPKSYKELIVWQKSMKLAEKVYLLVKALPREETYALSDQIRRAAVSIPSNIAEGYARQSQKEFLQFLCIARGSRAELETQLLLAQRLGYFCAVPQDLLESTMDLLDEISRMLYTLTSRLSNDESADC